MILRLVFEDLLFLFFGFGRWIVTRRSHHSCAFWLVVGTACFVSAIINRFDNFLTNLSFLLLLLNNQRGKNY